MYLGRTIEELHELLKSGQVKSSDLIKESIDKSKKLQDKCNAFITIMDDVKAVEVREDKSILVYYYFKNIIFYLCRYGSSLSYNRSLCKKKGHW